MVSCGIIGQLICNACLLRWMSKNADSKLLSGYFQTSEKEDYDVTLICDHIREDFYDNYTQGLGYINLRPSGTVVLFSAFFIIKRLILVWV